jgi:hypothetical protein
MTFVARPPREEPEASEAIHAGAVRGDGPLYAACAECGELVVEGGDVDSLPAFLFECPTCETLLRLDLRGLALVH